MRALALPRIRERDEWQLAGMALIDAAGTGLFIAGSAVYFVEVVHLSPAVVGLGLSLAGVSGLLTTVPLGMLADRIGAPRLLVVLSLLRAAGFVGYVFVESPASFFALAAVLGVADGAVPPLNQALVGLVVGEDRRMRVMATQRAVRNIGFTVGAGFAAVALALRTATAYNTIFLGNAATFVVVALVVASLGVEPATPSRGGRRRRTRPRLRDVLPRYDSTVLGGAAVNGVLSLHMTLLGAGIPLWLVRHTGAPHALAAVLVAVNTVLVVLLQVHLTQGTGNVPGSAAALRRAGISLGTACLLLAASDGLDALWASILLAAAVVAVTLGELWQSAGGWGLSFALAPSERRSEVLALFGTGASLQQVLAPPLLTGVVFRTGPAGWAALAIVLATTGCLAVRIVDPARRVHRRSELALEGAKS